MANDISETDWVLLEREQGEFARIFAPKTTGAVAWKPANTFPPASTLVWFKASFDLPAADNATSTAAATSNMAVAPAQLSYALDLSSVNKGVAFVNGFELGRYWLKPGQCKGECAPPIKNGHCYMHWKGCGKPTQTLYHVPTPVLKPSGNLVVIFEETASVVARRDLDAIKLVQLHSHP